MFARKQKTTECHTLDVLGDENTIDDPRDNDQQAQPGLQTAKIPVVLNMRHK